VGVGGVVVEDVMFGCGGGVIIIVDDAAAVVVVDVCRVDGSVVII